MQRLAPTVRMTDWPGHTRPKLKGRIYECNYADNTLRIGFHHLRGESIYDLLGVTARWPVRDALFHRHFALEERDQTVDQCTALRLAKQTFR